MRVKNNAQERQKQKQKKPLQLGCGLLQRESSFFVVAFKGVVIGFGEGDLLDGDGSFSQWLSTLSREFKVGTVTVHRKSSRKAALVTGN